MRAAERRQLLEEAQALARRCLHREAQWVLDLVEAAEGAEPPASLAAAPESLRMARARNMFALRQYRSVGACLDGEPGPEAAFLRLYARLVAIELDVHLGSQHRGPDYVRAEDVAGAPLAQLAALLEELREALRGLAHRDSYLLWLYLSEHPTAPR